MAKKKRVNQLIAGELRRRSATGSDLIETEPLAAPDGFKVIVIGLGIAGLVAVHYLQQMGLDFTVFERAPSAGGVWYQNTYPGAGVDTPSHLYSFSFIDRDWQKHFELRDELHRYFQDVYEHLGVGDRVQFRHPLREGLGYRWVTSEVPERWGPRTMICMALL